MGTSFVGFGRFVQNPPNFVPAKNNFFCESLKSFPAKFILFLYEDDKSNDTDSEWEDRSEDFERNTVDLIIDAELE